MAIATRGKRIKMSIEKWIDIPDNPSQRDTEKHAMRARKAHLKQLSATHDKVAAATIDGVIVCKIDGHTRSFLWERSMLDRPHGNSVYVDLYEVKDLSEASDIYRQFDSPNAVETTTDKMFSGTRMAGITLVSPLLKTLKFMVALQMASLRSDVASRSKKHEGIEHQLISKWSNELTTIDSWNLPASSIPGPIIALSLMLLRSSDNHHLVSDFIHGVALKRISITPDKPADGITHLVQCLERRRLKKTMSGWENLVDILGEGLACWRRFKGGILSARGVSRPADLGEWIKSVNFTSEQGE